MWLKNRPNGLAVGRRDIADLSIFGEMWGWLSTPLLGDYRHAIPQPLYWHARMMVLGWNLILPLGMLVARFLKVPLRNRGLSQLDSKLWWHLHLVLQCSGVAVMTLGALMALGRGSMRTGMAAFHHWIGWGLVGLGWLQILGGVLRGTKGGPTATTLRGDHYDMTRRRIIFEQVHKLGGWLTIPLIIAATALGLYIVDAPRWMPTALTLWWLLLITCCVWLQRAGYCIDTYQAIWGPDAVHPGNARRPIGWGVRRIGESAKPVAEGAAPSFQPPEYYHE